MKHEMMLRAIGEIDDDLVAQAYKRRAKAHKRRALPRMLAAAACLALILTAAFTASRNAERGTLFIGGTALTGAPASGEALTWTVEAPDENTRYTLSLDGKAAAVLRYDGAKGCWVAERP